MTITWDYRIMQVFSRNYNPLLSDHLIQTSSDIYHIDNIPVWKITEKREDVHLKGIRLIRDVAN